MKKNYITALALALSLLTGCINIRVNCPCKPGHHESGEADEHEEKGEKECKGKCHDDKKHGEDDKEECEKCDAKGHQEKARDDDDEKEEGKMRARHKESDEDDEKEDAKGSKAREEARLKAKAKISESTARRIAMEKVPNGTIREGELEMENGKLQWSFDIATPGTRDITEVNINAINGHVIDISKETPADQAKENAEEAREKSEKE